MEYDPQALLRILCGLAFLPHVVLKILHAKLAQETFAKVGLRPGPVFLGATVVMEIVAAIGLILNIYPEISAALGVFVLMGASYAVLRLNGGNWRWNKGGPEYMVFWSIACILAVL